jgi:hypothetical protein
MNSTPFSEVAPGVVRRVGSATRVRHQAREAAAVMAFSAATSVGCAVVLLFAASLGR